MSSKFRFRGGDAKPRVFKTDADYPIEAGDLLFVHPANGCVRPASAMANQGSAALNQDAFQQYFAGVAMEKSGLQEGETSFRLTTDRGYVTVATGGLFEFDCASHQWTPGALVGVAADTAGCEDQKVASAASASLAIGRAVPSVHALSNATTKIVVEIRSTVMESGVLDQVSGSGSGQ